MSEGVPARKGSAPMILEELTKEEVMELEAARGRQASFIRRFLHSEGRPGLSLRKVFLAAMHKLLHAVDHVFCDDKSRPRAALSC